MESPKPNADHPVGQRLRNAGIIKAVIIDDAYDSPKRDNLRIEISEFWASIERDEQALDELTNIKAEINSEDDIDDVVIDKLWTKALKGELESLSDACKNDLFSRKFEKLSPLNDLRDHLDRIGIEPILLGSGDELPSEPVKLFFLDFFLGPDPSLPAQQQEAIHKAAEGLENHQSIQAAMTKAEEIRKQFDDAFIVLMSSKPDVELARDKFREKTGLLEGLFGYVPKEQLVNEKDLYLRLGTWAMGMPARHDIQRFVEALESSVKNVSEEFVKRVKSLSFEDYVYIYSLSLRDEGHPLGEYMMWLYKALIAHLVHNNERILEEQRKLDTLEEVDIGQYVPLKIPPSIQLAEIYKYALTEPGVDELGPHPAADKESTEPYLQLGDLFIKDNDNDVLLVITPACDLAYSPPNPKRQFPNELSVLLEPGRLRPIDQEVRSGFKLTHLFEFEGKPFKIEWDHTRVISKKYGEVGSWLQSEGYSRKARLITPHALEIQQHFSANLTRVGMPIRPPMYRRAYVEVYGENEQGVLVPLRESISEGAILIDGKSGVEVLLTVESVSSIIDSISTAEHHYRNRIDVLDKSDKDYLKRFKRQNKKLENLQELRLNYEEWLKILENPTLLPAQELFKGVLKVFCNHDFKGKLPSGALIAINIRYDGSEPSCEEDG